MSGFKLKTSNWAVNAEGVSLGTHSRDTLEYEGHGKRILVEREYDDNYETMIVYHPTPEALPQGVAPTQVYTEILEAARTLNHGRAEWGDTPPPT